ncbi:unnamed protein product [Clonostachys rosea f. rosea IK726]|uniref:Major facilitator superfamily (MFS) profile domain-containing protein n=2 Tax=Bionectria ochroleuca TaxID=29856 RepID=A0A0B7KEM3_BIOOC|nr:unnamed protein product [Clonostachys rosea f. rosea IK726]
MPGSAANVPTDDDGEPSFSHSPAQPRARGIRSVLLLLLLVNLAMSLYQLPLNRVIERRLCRDYYSSTDPVKLQPGGSVDESLCKIPEVQQSLGSIQGVMETTWIVGDFIMTIPLGFVAQSRGRHVVLLLNLVSRAFMIAWAVIVGYFDQIFPPNAIIAGPILSFLGGDCVFNSITYALVSDLTDDPVRRATYFGYMSSISYVVALLGPALGSATMSIILWLPFLLGVGLLLVAAPVILGLSFPPGHVPSDPDTEEQRQGLLSSPVLKAQDSQNRDSVFHSVVAHLRVLLDIITSHPRNFSLLLFSFFLTSLASSDTKLLVQYISGRYHWTFASAGYLLSGKAVVNFLLLSVIVPRVLRSPRFAGSGSIDRANVRFANLCLVVSVMGAMGIAVAAEIWILVPSLFVYAVGSALPIFTLSLLKSPSISPRKSDDVDSNVDSHIFSIVMLVKTVGSLLGAPLMAALWVHGITTGGLALGTPYFVSGTCYLIAIGTISSIKVL